MQVTSPPPPTDCVDGTRIVSRRRIRVGLACLIGAGLLTAGGSTAARGQELGESSRGIVYNTDAVTFYSIETVPAGARLEMVGRNRLAGASPLAVPADIRGSYRVQAQAPGYETQRAQVVMPGGGAPVEIMGPHGRIGLGQLTQTIIWPGIAAMRDGDGLRGSTWFLAGSVAFTAALASNFQIQQRIDDANAARQRVQDAETRIDETLAEVDVVFDVAAADRATSARRDWAIVAGSVWGLSIFDRFALSPRLKQADVGLTDVSIQLRPMSSSKAALRSLIPGQGQFYARRSRAAALAAFGTMGAGYGLLVAELAYGEAVERVAGVEVLYNDPQADPEELEVLRPILEDEVRRAESRQKTRNLLIGITAGAWALNILDAYLSTPVASPSSPYGARLSPTLRVAAHGGMAAGVAWSF